MLRRFLLLSVCWLGTLSAAGETFVGTLHLHDGCPLRGTLTRTESGYTLQNQLGSVQIESGRVAHVVRHGDAPPPPVASQPSTPPAEPTPKPEEAPQQPEEAAQQPEAPEPKPKVERDPDARLADFARLSPDDVKRLKLAELQVNPPERVQVRLTRGPQGTPLEVLQKRDENFQPGSSNVQQAAAVVRTSGYEFLDQIQLRGETRTFRTFRRGVLPTVIRGCVRSGCHGGPTAQRFRLPAGSGEAEAYNAFVVLNRVRVGDTPLIDRENPDRSVLLDYLLPPDEATVQHPKVTRGRLTPPFKTRDDDGYQAILDWISTLQTPQPDYALEAQLPDWLE